MKIIITQKEKGALEYMVNSKQPYDVCKVYGNGTHDICKKCPLDKFEVFRLCDNSDCKNQAKQILNIAEVTN